MTYKEILDFFLTRPDSLATQGRITISTYFIGTFPSGVKRFSLRVHKGTRHFKLILFFFFFCLFLVA